MFSYQLFWMTFFYLPERLRKIDDIYGFEIFTARETFIPFEPAQFLTNKSRNHGR
jgi:hypothetical protein